MNKIKNFRLIVNRNMAWRHIKSKLEEVPEKAEEIFQESFELMQGALNPAAVFDTLDREDGPREQGFLWKDCLDKIVSGSDGRIKTKNVLAISFVMMSLGEQADRLMNSDEYNEIRKNIIQGFCTHALGLAGNFIFRIIRDNAHKERCVVDAKVDLPVEQNFSGLQGLLDPEKIGIIVQESSALNPSCVGFFCVPWMKKKRK